MSLAPSPPVRSHRRHPAVWWSRMKWRWPLLFWLVALAGAAFFYFHGARTSGVLGYVEISEHNIAVLEAGRLRSVEVQVGDSVQARQLLAVMDDSLLIAEQEVERAYLADAQGLVPDAVQFMTQMERQFTEARYRVEKDLQDLKFLQSRDQAELDAHLAELARLEKLYTQRLIPASALTDPRIQVAVLTRQLADYPAQISQGMAAVADWHNLYEQAQQDVTAAAGDRLKSTDSRKENHTAEALKNQIRLLDLRRAATEIRAPTDGVITAVNRLSDEVVADGEVVIQLIETNSARVVGFLPEAVGSTFQVGAQVHVYRIYTSRAAGTATLLAIEPAIRALPGRISPVSSRTLRGRALYFRLDPGSDLAPGETVELHGAEPLGALLKHWFSRFLPDRRS